MTTSCQSAACMRAVFALIAGCVEGTIADVGDRFDGDVLDGDPQRRWKLSSQAALAASGLFATPVEVDAAADDQTQLLALTGRRT